MSYSIAVLPQFISDAKALAKKYPAIKNNIAELGARLEEEPFYWDASW